MSNPLKELEALKDANGKISSVALANYLGVDHSEVLRITHENWAALEKYGPIELVTNGGTTWN